MAHIILPNPSHSPVVVGGVRFVDGQADSPLGRHRRGYFEAIGATITDDEPRDYPGADSTKAELVAYAQGHGITTPNGTKAEVLEAIQMAPLPAAEE